MSEQKGRSFLIKTTDAGSPSADFDTIGGLRSKSLKINGGEVDVTDQDSGGFRELMAAAGITSVDVSGDMIYEDSQGQNLLFTRKLAQSIDAYHIVVPGLGTFSGNFMVGDLEITGPHDGAVTSTLSLVSSGTITLA